MPTIQAEHPKASFAYDGDRIVTMILQDDVELTLEDIQEQRAIVSSLVNGRPYCMLIITGERAHSDEEGRTYAANNIPPGRIAEAIVVRSLPVRLMVNFYVKFHKPGISTRLFNNRDEALVWLNEMLIGYDVSLTTSA